MSSRLYSSQIPALHQLIDHYLRTSKFVTKKISKWNYCGDINNRLSFEDFKMKMVLSVFAYIENSIITSRRKRYNKNPFDSSKFLALMTNWYHMLWWRVGCQTSINYFLTIFGNISSSWKNDAEHKCIFISRHHIIWYQFFIKARNQKGY